MRSRVDQYTCRHGIGGGSCGCSDDESISVDLEIRKEKREYSGDMLVSNIALEIDHRAVLSSVQDNVIKDLESRKKKKRVQCRRYWSRQSSNSVVYEE